MLINTYGSELGIIKQEIEKCMISILPKTSISNTDLIHISSNGLGEYGKLSKAIKIGDIKQIIHSLKNLIQLKEDPHKIINQFLFQINQLLPIAQAMNSKLSAEDCAQMLGKHPFYVKKQMESLQKNPMRNKLGKIIQKLALIDEHIKKGKLSSKLAVLNLSNSLKYQI